ncbi:DUF5359 family protein [Sediminibacillus massiliensis]|uniref:DUF5359 family protein n=1 Tax=Sediminibacillus massiliensis TaxID=1926277 RepID=UPI0011773479|nr:DUF5359 family protein [Sediminibacillus massiliensis]
MKRVERYIVALLGLHAFLLVSFQLLVLHTDVNLFLNPVYEYVGVAKMENTTVLEKLQQVIDSVLSF